MKLNKRSLLTCMILMFLLSLYVNAGTTVHKNEQANSSLILLIIVSSCCSFKVEYLASNILLSVTIGTKNES